MTQAPTTVKPIATAPLAVPERIGRTGEPKKQFDFFELMQALISPRAFFVGVMLGFVSCCIAGYATTKVSIFKDFQRFYFGISPETFLYPTVSEMVAIAHSKVRDDQVLVIVGGNSILNGVGQRVEKLWTKRLQEELGPKFCVLNFAFRGALPFEGGYFAFEKLIQKHPKSLYVTVSAPSICANPEGGPTYGYMYWQARANHYLLADQPRDKAVSARVAALTGADAEKIRELQIRCQLESICYLSDLWNAVSVKVVSTAWHSLEKRPFKPRRKTVDEEPLASPLKHRFDGQEKNEMPIVRGVSSLLFERKNDEWVPARAFWDSFSQQAEVIIPKQLRKNALVIFSPNCPFFERRLTQPEQERNKQAYKYGKQKWEDLGFHCMVANGRTDADYFDRVHLVPSGGAKLAVQLAPELQGIAKNQGWINE